MTRTLQQPTLIILMMVIIVARMAVIANAQDTAVTADEMLGCLHEQLTLGIDENQLKQIAPEADNTPSPGRVAVPGVYVEMRDLNGKPLAVSDRLGKTGLSNQSIGEAIYYYLENDQLVRVQRSIRVDPLGNTIDSELVKKIRNLLNTAEMRMSLLGKDRCPTLQIINNDQAMFVRFRKSKDPSIPGGVQLILEIEIVKTKLTRNNQLVELTGREDHERFVEFGTVFEELK